jgi:hypothetical protein
MFKKNSHLLLALTFSSLFSQSVLALELTVNVTDYLTIKSSVYRSNSIAIGEPIVEFEQSNFILERAFYQILSETKKGRSNKLIERSGYSNADVDKLITYLGIESLDKGENIYSLIEKVELTDIGIAEIRDAVVLAYSLGDRKESSQRFTIGFEKHRSSAKNDEYWKIGNFRNQIIYRELFFEGESRCIQYFKKNDPSDQFFKDC